MESETPSSASQPSRAVRTVLILDVAEYVRLMEEDQYDTGRRWRNLVGQIEHDVLPVHGGRLVESRGDSLVIEFPQPRAAVQAVFAIQTTCQSCNKGQSPERNIRLRMGMHVGEVFIGDRDVTGHTVNLAARLMTSLADPGDVVVSVDVRDQLTQALDADFEDLGERRLKNVLRPVRAFNVRPPGELARRSRPAGEKMRDRPSIAVLPFRNLSGVSANDFLGDVIADGVIAHLSRVHDLRVISRLSTTPFRDRHYEPRNVAEVLGVRYLITGSMQMAGGRIRLLAELTESDSGNVILADHFDGSLADIFELQDQISIALAKRIAPFVRDRDLQRARSRRPENLSAYERTLLAIDYLHRMSHEDMEKARDLLNAAIESDPSYVAPYAWLARWHVLRVGQGWSPDVERDTQDAKRYAQEAVEKDATDAWALAVHGLVTGYLHKELDKALIDFDSALSLNPSTASAWVWSTAALAWLGKNDEAIERAQRAIELSPLDPHMYSFTSIAGTAHAVAGNFEKAIDFCRRSLRENRMYASTHRILTISLALAGRIDEARLAAAELLRIEPGLTVRGFRDRYPGNSSTHVSAFCDGLASAGVPL